MRPEASVSTKRIRLCQVKGCGRLKAPNSRCRPRECRAEGQPLLNRSIKSSESAHRGDAEAQRTLTAVFGPAENRTPRPEVPGSCSLQEDSNRNPQSSMR